MSSRETEPKQDNQTIAEKSSQQHKYNVDAELAQRGLLATRGGISYIPHEQILEYIRNLEQQAGQPENTVES